jgi:3-oxoacyl-[acyl-carrier protein] reductase
MVAFVSFRVSMRRFVMSRVTLVTGGTRGIGYAVAEALLHEGGAVAITGTSTDGVMEAERKLADSVDDPGRIAGIVCDVREPASVEAAVRTAVARFGGIDALVNNAGVGTGAPIAELSHDEWHRIIDTNLTGVFYCCRSVIPHMRSRGGGWIVNVSSLASKNPFAGGAAYCASKAAINAFSEALMQELRYDGIRVTYILPGSVATEFSGRQSSSGAEWKLLPQDVAEAIVDVMNHPLRSLPSRIEIRPSKPPRK